MLLPSLRFHLKHYFNLNEIRKSDEKQVEPIQLKSDRLPARISMFRWFQVSTYQPEIYFSKCFIFF